MILSLLLFACILGRVFLDHRCAHPISPRNSLTTIAPAVTFRGEFDTGITRLPSEPANFTSILTSIGLHETICYTFERVITDDELGIHEATQYEMVLGMLSVEEVYPIREQYNFSIPRVRTTCACDCPGGRDYCSSAGGEMAQECEGICVHFFTADQTVSGCTITLGQSQMCCKSDLTPLKGDQGISELGDDEKLFTALKLGEPLVLGSIQQKLVNVKTNQVKYETVRKVPLRQSHLMEDKFRTIFHLRGGAPPHLPIDTWYFGPADDRGVLFTGSEVNARDEWDVRKLGWFKHPHPDMGPQLPQALVAAQMSGTVTHCGNQDMDFHLEVLYTNSFPEDAYEISRDLKARSASYKKQGDKVVVLRGQAPRVEVALTLTDSLQVELLKDESYVGEFRATITVQGEGEVVLEVLFHEGRGSLEGEFYRNRNISSVREKFFIYLSEEEHRSPKTVMLTTSCFEDLSEVCFRPFEYPDPPQCVVAECIIQEHAIKPLLQGIRTHQSTRLSKWTDYLSPVQWLNGMDSTLEIVLMCLTLGTCVLLIIIIVKLHAKLTKN